MLQWLFLLYNKNELSRFISILTLILDLNGFHELQYCKPTDSTIDRMENSVLCAKPKIKGISSLYKSALRDYDLSDTDSDESALLGQDGVNESKLLSSDTLNKFCEMLLYCVPFNNHLHVCKQHKSTANCWCPCSSEIWEKQLLVAMYNLPILPTNLLMVQTILNKIYIFLVFW